MCKAHSKVTHIKQQKYFHHLKRRGYNTLEVMKIVLLFSTDLWLDGFLRSFSRCSSFYSISLGALEPQ